MAYVDGFVLPVPKKNMAAYRRMANKAGKTWMKYGALTYVEAVADDVKPGKTTSFPQSVKLKGGETVIFSWITYKSRKHRDQVNTKVMAYFAKKYASKKDQSMPFDPKKVAYSGFKTIVEI